MDRMGRGWYRDGMEGPTLAGAGSVVAQLSLKVRAKGSKDWQWDAVAATKCVSAARAQSICVQTIRIILLV